MSGLARYFNSNNTGVSGYDRVSSDLTQKMEDEGIEIHFDDNPDLIPGEFLNQEMEKTLVVYTPAIPEDHKELNYLRSKGYKVQKRSEVLAEITLQKFTIAVAGTHGKTTVTSMIAHLFMESDVNFSAFVGGVLQDYESNYLRNPGQGKEIIVVEADEFDRSFHRLRPDIAVITSVEADHLDIYGSAQELEKAFLDFASCLKPGGKLLVQERFASLFQNAISYGTNGNYSYSSSVSASGVELVYNRPGREDLLSNIQVRGDHNIENASAALAVGDLIGLGNKELSEGLNNYPGVKRRFEKVFESEERVLIDDYAHHPTEIKAAILAARKLYPEQTLTVLFQPHLFSRTRDFADEFAKSLDLADQAMILEIYPAREKPIEGVNSELLIGKMEKSAIPVSKEEVIERLEDKRGVVLILGAGDIDRLVEPLKQAFEEK